MTVCVGGAAGVLLAVWVTKALVTLADGTLPASARIGLDVRVLLFALAAATLAALLSGLLPAIHAARAAISDTLREGGRQGGPSGSRRTRGTLVAAEVALALVLLTGAGLLLRTLWGMQHVERGFDPRHVGVATISLPAATYRNAAETRAFYGRLIDKVRALPGVQSAALASGVLMPLVARSATFTFEHQPPAPPEQQVEYPFEYVSPGFFETIGARIVRGRAFAAQDTDRAPMVAVVNETLARTVWAGEEALGRRLRFGDGEPWVTVVGVVKDLRRGDLTRPIRPEMYFCSVQQPRRTLTLLVRSEGDPSLIVPSIRRELHSIDPQLSLFGITTLEAQLAGTLTQPRFQATLLGGFAAIALLLAALGIYGVTSHAVSQRTQEVGIRMAMGARRSDVRLLILRQHVTPALIGVAAGFAGAVALSRFLTALLYGVRAIDPATYALVALSLIAVAVAACWVPASRATRVDPLIALRAE